MYKHFVFCGLLIINYVMCQKATNYPRVCVIGAGVAGLSAARYLKEEGINFTVLECTRYVGGTWRYDPRVGVDENDLPLHTSMYKHLRTNLPKPTMELNGYRLPDDTPSFPGWERYYEYLKNLTKNFDIVKHIKFLHLVVSVKRIDNMWKVKHKHVVTEEEFEEDYDFVLVGSGHYSKPHRPHLKGEEKFKGTIIHSHDYRTPEPYADRRVLIVGAGPSGMEISLLLAEVTSRLVHSHHSPAMFNTSHLPSHYVKRPDVKELNETGAVFVDGSYEEVDDVILCTGYEYDFPFLDSSSGLTISPKSVVSLYKHMINIHEPTMVFMGLVVRACLVVAIDAQARYATALIKGNFTLPSKEQMMVKWQSQADDLTAEGRPMKDIHLVAEKEDAYYEELTRESGIAQVPPVMSKIRRTNMRAKTENLYTYRNYVYTVIDNQTFTRRLEDESTTSNYTAILTGREYYNTYTAWKTFINKYTIMLMSLLHF